MKNEDKKFSRHRQRIIALQILYSLSVNNKLNKKDINEEFKKLNKNEDGVNINIKKKYYFQELIVGVIENKEELDEKIDQLAIDWDIDRMATIDVNILRIALFEIKNGLPVGVAIDEAVELAKEFSGTKSAQFVNGILGESVKNTIF